MEIRIRETGQVMYEGEFRALHPNTSFPQVLTAEILNDAGADVVLEGPQATTSGHYEFSYRDGVEQINDQWFTKYSIGPVFTDGETTAAEQEAAYRATKDTAQAESVRKQRDEKLAECDWTQVEDSPVDKQVWATYRQALRDVPSQTSFPWEITWPTQPE